MDHLPAFRYHAEQYPQVPYLCSKPYDGKDFRTYPERQGWQPARLFAGDFVQGKEREVVAAFLQNWLYFGLLSEVCRYGGAKFKVSTFTRKTKARLTLVSNTNLEEYVSKWASKLPCYWMKRHQEQHLQLMNTNLDTVHKLSDALYDQCQKDSADCPLPSNVVISIKLLGQTIDYALIDAAFDAALKISRRNWGFQEIATARMMKAGWCPRDISLAQRWLTGLPMYCVSFVDRPPNKHNLQSNDHSRCSEFGCEANQIDEKHYKSRHVDENCDCDLWGPDPSELAAQVQAGQIPEICIESTKKRPDGPKGVECGLRPARLGGTIISHVWSDGLGNPAENKIYTCQLEYIRDILLGNPGAVAAKRAIIERSHCDKEGQIYITNSGRTWLRLKHNVFHQPLQFWLDTLCIPLQGPERKMAIARMKNIYASGMTTLVLDSELLQLEHKFCKTEEIQLRVALSGWMSRCWTFQEAVIAGGKLHVQFKDGVYDLPKDLCHMRGSNMIENSLKVSLPIENPAADAVKRAAVAVPIVAGLAFVAWRVYKGNMKFEPVDQPQATKRRNKTLVFADKRIETPTGILSISDRLSSEVKLFFRNMICLWTCHPEPGTGMYYKDRVSRIVASWHGLHHRTTSRESDRFINFTFACAQTEDDFKLLEKTQILTLPVEQGFRAWLERQPVLPTGLLFVKGPKMLERGYRWAPKRVMPEHIEDEALVRRRFVQENGDVPPLRRHMASQEGECFYDGPLEVQKPGLVIQATTEQIRHFVLADSPSAVWFYVRDPERPIMFEVLEDSGMSKDDVRKGMADWDGHISAIVLVGWPDEDDVETGALLHGVEETGDTIHGTYSVRVRVRALHFRPRDATKVVTGLRRMNEQVWRVS